MHVTCVYISQCNIQSFLIFSEKHQIFCEFKELVASPRAAQIIMALESISTGNYGGLCVLKNKIMVIKDVGVE